MESPSSKMIGGPMGRRRRRVFPLIDGGFQWKYTLGIMAFVVAIMVGMGSFLYQAHLENSALVALDAHPEILDKVIEGDRIFLVYLVSTILVFVLIVMLVGLLLTHRMSGPLFVLTRSLGVMAKGIYPELRELRKNDEFQEVYSAFELAIESMRARDRERLSCLEEVRSLVTQAQTTNDPACLRDAMELLAQERNALVRALGTERDEKEKPSN